MLSKNKSDGASYELHTNFIRSVFELQITPELTAFVSDFRLELS